MLFSDGRRPSAYRLTIALIPYGSSRLDTTRLDMFDVSSLYILAVSSLSNSTARHTRHDELVDTLNVSSRVET